jgi:dTDP-4-dehydrorhamnose 3,5-epimerase
VKITPTRLPEVLVIEPRVFGDDRGFFLEMFNDERFASHGLPAVFRQDNRSRSACGVLRGLHYQLEFPQGKLVTAVHGEIYDVAVDIRVGSPTFGRYAAVTLCADTPRFLWVPPGFAHGFCVMSESADVVYKCTELYRPEDERGVLWSDPGIGIEWPVSDPLLSDRDRQYAVLDAARVDLPRYAS